MESLIFDVDGTLWDAVALVAEGWNDGLQSMGFAPHCTEQSIRPLFGKTMTEIAQVVVPSVPQEQAMEVMDRCMDGEMARLRRDPCHIFYPGVKETLTELHKTHRLFIVSNCQQGKRLSTRTGRQGIDDLSRKIDRDIGRDRSRQAGKQGTEEVLPIQMTQQPDRAAVQVPTFFHACFPP